MTSITVRVFSDYHHHLRQLLEFLIAVRHAVAQIGTILPMPNTDPPILTGPDAVRYETQIIETARPLTIRVVKTIQLTEDTTEEMIDEAAACGVEAIKAYPRGRTMNSQYGILNYPGRYKVIERAKQRKMKLLLHGENPAENVDFFKREEAFKPIFLDIVRSFPGMDVVFEHLSTRVMRDCILEDCLDNVVCTITPPHLAITMNDIAPSFFDPHCFCMPCPKNEEDRQALIEMVKLIRKGSKKCFLGSDSALHTQARKHNRRVSPGNWSAPILGELMAHVFEQNDMLDLLEPFSSTIGDDYYGKPHTDETITLVREPRTVPDEIDGIVPFWWGRQLNWRVTPRQPRT